MEPRPGKHPEGSVPLHEDLPGEASVLGRQGGGHLEVVQQGSGLADPLPSTSRESMGRVIS